MSLYRLYIEQVRNEILFKSLFDYTFYFPFGGSKVLIKTYKGFVSNP